MAKGTKHTLITDRMSTQKINKNIEDWNNTIN